MSSALKTTAEVNLRIESVHLQIDEFQFLER